MANDVVDPLLMISIADRQHHGHMYMTQSCQFQGICCRIAAENIILQNNVLVAMANDVVDRLLAMPIAGRRRRWLMNTTQICEVQGMCCRMQNRKHGYFWFLTRESEMSMLGCCQCSNLWPPTYPNHIDILFHGWNWYTWSIMICDLHHEWDTQWLIRVVIRPPMVKTVFTIGGVMTSSHTTRHNWKFKIWSHPALHLKFWRIKSLNIH